jgi:hypothetical protein
MNSVLGSAVTSSMITLRSANSSDATFLKDVLIEAINWDPAVPRR